MLGRQRDQEAVVQIEQSPVSDLLQIFGEDDQMYNSLNFLGHYQAHGEAKNFICSFQRGKRRDLEMSCPGLSKGFSLWKFRGRFLLHPLNLALNPREGVWHKALFPLPCLWLYTKEGKNGAKRHQGPARQCYVAQESVHARNAGGSG